MVDVDTIATAELGDRSYIAHDGSTALVIDPQRDIDRVVDRLDMLGLALGAVAETHIHNDYLSGGLALAQAADVPYLVAAADRVGFKRAAVSDGDVLMVGSLSVQVVATPGHTPNHLAYLVNHGAEALVFTGGSLLFGAVGRTDLVDPKRGEELARAQYRSVRRLAASLDGSVAVLPTHGFGSFCSASPPAGGDQDSTISLERSRNDALVIDDEEDFVRRLLAGLGSYPAYYSHMTPRNLAGVSAADLSPAMRIGPAELRLRIARGEWVVDLRDRREFAADHLAGTYGVELNQQFGTYLGWIFDYDAPLTLIGASDEQLAAAQRQLVRIGIDRPSGVAAGDLRTVAGRDAPRRGYRVVGFEQLETELNTSGGLVLDVRRDEELTNGRIPGALHVPLSSLLHGVGDLPDVTLYVHCASGFRAGIAASVLDRAGRHVVLIDEPFSRAIELRLAA